MQRSINNESEYNDLFKPIANSDGLGYPTIKKVLKKGFLNARWTQGNLKLNTIGNTLHTFGHSLHPQKTLTTILLFKEQVSSR